MEDIDSKIETEKDREGRGGRKGSLREGLRETKRERLGREREVFT